MPNVFPVFMLNPKVGQLEDGSILSRTYSGAENILVGKKTRKDSYGYNEELCYI